MGVEVVHIGPHVLYRGDCLEGMKALPDSSVDLIATDPPYFRVKSEAWDRQWADAGKFLDWMGDLCAEWHRILKPNGSLYVFASPKMAARVECKIGERFNVLNHIVWPKSDEPSHALIYGDDRFRQFVMKSERIIFAEHYGSDNIAKGEAGYGAKCDELRGFVFESVRSYLAKERDRAGWTTRRVAEEYQKVTGSRTVTGMAGHWFERSQWALPTAENYAWLQALFNASCNGSGPQYLRREYEDLRREYEDLRRPFSVTADVPYTDVWTFPTVNAYPGKHPCEKPLAMMEHIIRTSSRPGALVLDCFMGSGVTGEACKNQGRIFYGIEKEPRWHTASCRRIEEAHTGGPLLKVTIPDATLFGEKA